MGWDEAVDLRPGPHRKLGKDRPAGFLCDEDIDRPSFCSSTMWVWCSVSTTLPVAASTWAAAMFERPPKSSSAIGEKIRTRQGPVGFSGGTANTVCGTFSSRAMSPISLASSPRASGNTATCAPWKTRSVKTSAV